MKCFCLLPMFLSVLWPPFSLASFSWTLHYPLSFYTHTPPICPPTPQSLSPGSLPTPDSPDRYLLINPATPTQCPLFLLCSLPTLPAHSSVCRIQMRAMTPKCQIQRLIFSHHHPWSFFYRIYFLHFETPSLFTQSDNAFTILIYICSLLSLFLPLNEVFKKILSSNPPLCILFLSFIQCHCFKHYFYKDQHQLSNYSLTISNFHRGLQPDIWFMYLSLGSRYTFPSFPHYSLIPILCFSQKGFCLKTCSIHESLNVESKVV